MGFMGSGKSTIGRQLAKALHLEFIDLDRFIEDAEGKSIPEIFRQQGEAEFRQIESLALENALAQPNRLIALGGGTPCQPGAIRLIREKSFSIYLKISLEELVRRLAGSPVDRPLLFGKTSEEIREFAEGMLAVRESFYLQADRVMESDSITIEELLKLFPLEDLPESLPEIL